MQSERWIHKLDLDKLKNVTAELSKLSNIDNDVKKSVCDKLVTKINAIDSMIPSTSGLITITQYDSDKQDLEEKIDYLEKKMPNTRGLHKNSKIESKINSIKGFCYYCCSQY